MQNKITKCFIIGLLCALVFSVGIITGLLVKQKGSKPNRTMRADKTSAEWKFISPLLRFGEIKNISNQSIADLKNAMNVLVEEYKNSGKLTDAAVYFRDLNNGPWIGINEKEDFVPASLLKVPMMINILKQDINDPGLLEKVFVYKATSTNSGEYFKAGKELEQGQKYSVRDALEYMIKYSDNNAYFVLGNFVSQKSLLSDSYEYLGIPEPGQGPYNISARTYASFFRILYNASFLGKRYSELALKMLSGTTFIGGIRAGVPAQIVVSHKFGERQLESGIKYLHDCGIVYFPERPYLLCVMTKGNNFDHLESFIQGVSRTVYQMLDKDIEAVKNY